MVYMPQLSPFVFMAVLGMAGLPVLGVLVSLFRPDLAKLAAGSVGVVATGYLGLLLYLSLSTPEKILGPGQLKYFCEMDCHLAYSVAGVHREADRTVVTVRAWFDEKTIGPRRGNAPLTEGDRHIVLVDGEGHSYAPAPVDLHRPLRPGESFTADLVFPAPSSARDLRLLINMPEDLPSRFLIGHENSLLHKKVWFKVESPVIYDPAS